MQNASNSQPQSLVQTQLKILDGKSTQTGSTFHYGLQALGIARATIIFPDKEELSANNLTPKYHFMKNK